MKRRLSLLPQIPNSLEPLSASESEVNAASKSFGLREAKENTNFLTSNMKHLSLLVEEFPGTSVSFLYTMCLSQRAWNETSLVFISENIPPKSYKITALFMVLKFRCLEPWLGEKWGYYVNYI